MAHRPRNRPERQPFAAVVATVPEPKPRVVDVEAVRARHCGTKLAYGPWSAREAAARMTAQARATGSPAAYESYRCVFCSSWHTGHVASVWRLEELAAAIRMEEH